MTAQGPPVFSTQGTCVDPVTGRGETCGLNFVFGLGTVRFKSPLMSDESEQQTFRNKLINTRGENTDQFSPYHHTKLGV
eukprot:3038552-Prymnesium_polylepis.1